ncbi:hypothetical protein R1sor_003814 [Riccia sorocarpa]|uniref:RCC1-like domain-containing protein n=1 Tax=Riccia sorocarpa TaxID=122646 RepID=A0ABD3H5K0_9MARC
MSRTRSSVWSWGAGTRGQLANGAFTDSLEPVLLPNFLATSPPSWDGVVNDMACGGAHGVAILSVSNNDEEQAQVVSWGNGESGALGHGETEDRSVPKVVEFFNGIRVSSVAAGWSHTAFVTLSGTLYTCGSGSFGQLGHGDFGERLIPQEVVFSKRVVMAACGMRHTVVLTDDRGTRKQTSLYSFGAAKRGQLGLSRSDPLQEYNSSSQKLVKVSVPKEIPGFTHQLDDGVMLVAANGDHSAAITSHGHLFVWGRGFSGEPDYFEPRQVKHQQAPSADKSHFCGWNHFTHVALGWNHGLALGVDGVLWAWGSNQRGQLGSVDGEERVSISSSSEVSAQDGEEKDGNLQQWPKMVRVHGIAGNCLFCSAGSEHSAALLDSGELRVWGWGEHGQLGLGDTSDVLLPQLVSLPGEFEKDTVIWRVFCGSGFTFLIANQNV